jgi:L-fuculose-phosphate aldolase
MHGRFDPRFGGIGYQLIRAGRHLGSSGLIAAAEGNLSARDEDGNIIITAAGARKNELQPDDLILLSASGSVIRGDRQPSTELALHLAAYDMCSEAQAVIHAHPVAATAFAASEQVPEWRALAESIVTLGIVRLVPYAHPGTDAMGSSLRSNIAESRTLLLAHHGALTIGETLELALQRMELLERLCAIQCAAAGLGGLKALSAEEQARLRNQ